MQVFLQTATQIPNLLSYNRATFPLYQDSSLQTSTINILN
uniref:Uncharacterized protein n=1 Tax=Rhizophora mucronata TaxID=61149 RepID=A0A2P2NXE5_RHIMU